jgi:hypothetical protein
VSRGLASDIAGYALGGPEIRWLTTIAGVNVTTAATLTGTIGRKRYARCGKPAPVTST